MGSGTRPMLPVGAEMCAVPGGLRAWQGLLRTTSREALSRERMGVLQGDSEVRHKSRLLSVGHGGTDGTLHLRRSGYVELQWQHCALPVLEGGFWVFGCSRADTDIHSELSLCAGIQRPSSAPLCCAGGGERPPFELSCPKTSDCTTSG